MRLLEKCDAVLRIGGTSHGADEMIRLAQESGKIVFLQAEDVPTVFAPQYC
jgi:predicted peptidase